MKNILTLIALLISSLCFSQTDFLIRVRDPIFKSVVITQEKTIPNIKVKPGETIDYHLPSGQNIGFAALTIDAPLDTTKKWIFKISAVEDTGVIPVPTLVLKETINDTGNTRVTYVGTWLKFGSQSWTNGSCAGCTAFRNNDVSITSVIGSSASITFTGKKITVVAEFRENHGVANIEVRQGTTIVDSKTVDMYSNTKVNAPAEIFSSIVLPLGTYTVTVSLNSITTGRDSMVLDSFLIYE